MTSKTRRNTETAGQAYYRRSRQITKLIAEIESDLASHHEGPRHWGTVGNLEYIAERLEEAVAFLKHCEPENLPSELRGER